MTSTAGTIDPVWLQPESIRNRSDLTGERRFDSLTSVRSPPVDTSLVQVRDHVFSYDPRFDVPQYADDSQMRWYNLSETPFDPVESHGRAFANCGAWQESQLGGGSAADHSGFPYHNAGLNEPATGQECRPTAFGHFLGPQGRRSGHASSAFVEQIVDGVSARLLALQHTATPVKSMHVFDTTPQDPANNVARVDEATRTAGESTPDNNHNILFAKKRRRYPRVEGGYECREPGCDKLFDYYGDRTKHESYHRPESEYPHACPHCDKRFINRKDLTRHEKIHLRKVVRSQ